jgi:limonene 1,2-monooxygenase
MMTESIEVIIPLLLGERVTRKTDWFTLDGAHIQLGSFTRPHLELAVSCTHSPNGPRLAGRFGTGMLMFNPSAGAGFDALANQWAIVEEEAAAHGQTVDRRNWRLAAPMFVAATKEEARAEVRHGLDAWCRYMREINTLSVLPAEGGTNDYADALVDCGLAVIGTPDDAIAQIRRLQERSGGFGCFLAWGNDWASPEATLRSFELIATEVAPAINNTSASLEEAERWARKLQPELAPLNAAARQAAIDSYANERASRGTGAR